MLRSSMHKKMSPHANDMKRNSNFEIEKGRSSLLVEKCLEDPIKTKQLNSNLKSKEKDNASASGNESDEQIIEAKLMTNHNIVLNTKQ